MARQDIAVDGMVGLEGTGKQLHPCGWVQVPPHSSVPQFAFYSEEEF